MILYLSNMSGKKKEILKLKLMLSLSAVGLGCEAPMSGTINLCTAPFTEITLEGEQKRLKFQSSCRSFSPVKH